MMLREDYPDADSPEDECRRDHEAWGMSKAFEEMLPPELSPEQGKLLNIFYRCRKYSEELTAIPLQVMNETISQVPCEHDMAKFIIEAIDGHYLKICADKHKRDIEAMKKGGKQ